MAAVSSSNLHLPPLSAGTHRPRGVPSSQLRASGFIGQGVPTSHHAVELVGQDGWNGDGGWSDHNWGGRNARNAWNSPDKDKYDNVTTLGLKHPVPIEDRRELVLGLLNRLQEEVSAAADSAPAGNFRIAVAGWGPIIIHAMLYYLCRAKPSMPIRTLFNEEKKFAIADAVDMLWSELATLFPSAGQSVAALELLFECRFSEPTALLE